MNSTNKRVFFIAEAGVNHNGDLQRAKDLVKIAKEAGADAVKFQLFKPEELVTQSAPKAEYQEKNAGGKSQYEMLKELELNFDQHKELLEECNKLNILFMTSAFDFESLKQMPDLGVRNVKIPSGEITNLPYLRIVAQLPCDRVILSTGASNIEEVEAAINVLIAEGLDKSKLTLLHCNTEYPSPIEDLNLRAMITMKDRFGVETGYSDHSAGTEVALVATAMGATCIEKHFTSDKNLPGPDHKASLSPEELVEYVREIRRVETMMGSAEKTPSPSETKNREIVRKSIVAKGDVQKGELFSVENLTTKRPGSGMSPMCWDRLIGKAASKNYSNEDLIDETM